MCGALVKTTAVKLFLKLSSYTGIDPEIVTLLHTIVKHTIVKHAIVKLSHILYLKAYKHGLVHTFNSSSFCELSAGSSDPLCV